jgi:hypothetical protein
MTSGAELTGGQRVLRARTGAYAMHAKYDTYETTSVGVPS